ncbi:MAG: ABC transporter permease [Victivallaceae bacterium]|nr:ABC transporter permease [Victivallaceae bacterium]MDD3117400.1 ABC transporter permease [Victivallaceae bacterium]MDD3703111.1 ABC transporter permease [Victivallaceae bacterium]MDD4316976.1 ABC transporter permease [Victivallaceae bacterium]MDD5664240.1 ABC transporter permease [Victivallaceae bacterium]
MNQNIELSYTGMAAAYLLLLPVLLLSMRYKLVIVRDTLWAVGRMSLQLLLVGLYLRYIFQWNSLWINLLWVLTMSAVASWTTLRQAKLPVRMMFSATFTALTASFLGVLFYFVFLITGKSASDAALLIPIGGMLLGNSLRSNVVVLERFFHQLRDNRPEYELRLLCGANRSEALMPFMQMSLRAGISPQIASMATLGIVSLPGMMTGQLLGGATPMTAIQYQIAIMIGIFAIEMISTVLLLEVLAQYAVSYQTTNNHK